MMNGYGNMGGITSSNVMSSFDTSVDANSMMDLVSGSSSLMNGHGSTYDSGPSSFYASHNGKDKQRSPYRFHVSRLYL